VGGGGSRSPCPSRNTAYGLTILGWNKYRLYKKFRADGSVLKGAFTYVIRGMRPRGRPRKRWGDSVRELLEEIGGDWEQAYNRERWKVLVLAAKSLNGSWKAQKKKKYWKL
jgi:hypothetical protein